MLTSKETYTPEVRNQYGDWVTGTIAKDGQLSGEIDLLGNLRKVLVLIPTIDSAAISVQVSNESGGTFYPLHLFLDADGDGTVLQASAAGTGGIAVIFDIGLARYIKVNAGVAQTTAAVTITCRGIA